MKSFVNIRRCSKCQMEMTSTEVHIDQNSAEEVQRAARNAGFTLPCDVIVWSCADCGKRTLVKIYSRH
jgi:hypothetical protein